MMALTHSLWQIIVAKRDGMKRSLRNSSLSETKLEDDLYRNMKNTLYICSKWMRNRQKNVSFFIMRLHKSRFNS